MREFSRTIFLKLRSAASAVIVVFFTFSIYPLSAVWGENPPKDTPKSFEKVSVQNYKKAQVNPEKNAQIPQAPSSENRSLNDLKMRALAPSDYGSFKVFENSSSYAITDGNFAVVEFAANDDFVISIFEISELDATPRLLKKAQVEYPKNMLIRGIESEVRLSVFINSDGSVELDKVLYAENDYFKNAAINAVSDFLYEPPMRSGKRVRAKFVLPIPFKLEAL